MQQQHEKEYQEVSCRGGGHALWVDEDSAVHMIAGLTLHTHIPSHVHPFPLPLPTHAYILVLTPHKALVAVKDRLREVEGPDMTERMQDQIRQWFIEVRCVQRPVGGPMQQDLSTQGRHQPAVTTTNRLHSCVCVSIPSVCSSQRCHWQVP